MRISFLAVLAVALLVGLGVVVAVRALGLLGSPPAVVIPPTIVQTPPPQPPLALVATRPLYKNDAILPGDLAARPLTQTEWEDYRKHPDSYVMPIPQAAYFRFVAETMPANRPLRMSDLQEIRQPEPLHERLLPGSRAVDVSVPSDRSSGNLIQPNDWVDVYLITNVSRTDNATPFRRTGLLVRNALVVAKKDSLVPVYRPTGTVLTPYTLCMNPYRAALLEYGRTVGLLSIAPVSQTDRTRLEALAAEAREDPDKAQIIMYGEPGTKEAKDEKARLDQYAIGRFAVGTEDLARAMELEPIKPPPPPSLPIQVEVLHGTSSHSLLSFPTATAQELNAAIPAPEYQFHAPAEDTAKPGAAPATARPPQGAAPGGGTVTFPRPR